MDPDNWHSLDRKYTLNELLKLVAHVDGDIAECGCYKGFSAWLMCEATRGQPAVVHLFDSFEGLPEPEPCDGSYWRRGSLSTSENALHEALSSFDHYRVYRGWIPERYAEVADRQFRFVHIDVDLFRPTLDSLEFFYPRLRSGGILLLDDYGFKTCPGAKKAADGFFASKPERVAVLPTGQAFIIKQSEEASEGPTELERRRLGMPLTTRDSPPGRLEWTPELVDRFWSGIVQTRLVDYNFSRQAGRSLLIAIDHLLPRDGRVLDFGAGDGDLIRLMAQRGITAAAYEPSKNRIEELRASLADCPGYLGAISDGDAFDAVILAEVIEHILEPDLDTTLTRVADLTKAGGVLIVTTPNNEDLELSMAYCPVSNLLFHRWQHVRCFTHHTLGALLSRFGFEEVVTHHVGFDDAHFVPSDSLWGNDATPVPDWLLKIRRNEPVHAGSETNLLYIGRKRPG